MKNTVTLGNKTYTLDEIITLRKKLEKAICKTHTGKMEGLQSISTSTLLNPNCKKYSAVDGSICQYCYAQRMLKRYRSLEKKLIENTELLTTEVYPVEAFPVLNVLYFRFESFGDLINEIQYENYVNMCKRNPETHFALWTKNPHIIAAAGVEKPENLNVIYSSIFLNTRNESIMKKYPFIDKVFTVYDADTIEKENVSINCGGNHCATCLRCYKKNTETIINEKLK